jgi:hypothetical protein
MAVYAIAVLHLWSNPLYFQGESLRYILRRRGFTNASWLHHRPLSVMSIVLYHAKGKSVAISRASSAAKGLLMQDVISKSRKADSIKHPPPTQTRFPLTLVNSYRSKIRFFMLFSLSAGTLAPLARQLNY